MIDRDSRMESLRRRAERIELEIDALANMPESPESTDPDGALVVWWQREFSGYGDKQVYTYAAVLAGNGLWYCTGKRSHGMTWEELLDFSGYHKSANWAMWVSDEWSAVG